MLFLFPPRHPLLFIATFNKHYSYYTESENKALETFFLKTINFLKIIYLFMIYLFILAAPGLSFGTQDLPCGTWVS